MKERERYGERERERENNRETETDRQTDHSRGRGTEREEGPTISISGGRQREGGSSQRASVHLAVNCTSRRVFGQPLTRKPAEGDGGPALPPSSSPTPSPLLYLALASLSLSLSVFFPLYPSHLFLFLFSPFHRLHRHISVSSSASSTSFPSYHFFSSSLPSFSF